MVLSLVLICYTIIFYNYPVFWPRICQVARAIARPWPHIVSLPRLPPEIIDLVLDHLHDDKPSLQAASVVCKDWLLSCRFHLFYEISVEGVGFEPFAEFLYHTPLVRAYVRKLTLKPEDPRFIKTGMGSVQQGMAEIGPYVLVSICDMLPNLHSLRLIILDWCSHSTYGPHPWGCNTDPARLPSPIRRLQTLELNIIYAPSTQSGINGVPKIDILRYFKGANIVRISRVPPTLSIPEIHPLWAKELFLHHITDASTWIELLSQSRVVDNLQSFGTGLPDLFRLALPRTPIAIWLREDVGPKLEELTLSIGDVYDHITQAVLARPWKDIGLNTCTNLHSLTFSLLSPEPQAQESTWELLLYIISNMPCDKLETLSIVFKCRTPAEFSDPEVVRMVQTYNWDGFLRCCLRFKQLRRPYLSLAYLETYYHINETLYQPLLDTISEIPYRHLIQNPTTTNHNDVSLLKPVVR